MSRPRDPILRSQCVPLFLQELSRRSVALAPVLEAFTLAPESVAAPEADLALSEHDRFGALCAELSGAPYFGLEVGQGLGRGAYGLLEFVARKSPTLGGALERLAKYSHFLGDQISLSLARPSASRAQLWHRVEGSPVAAGRHFNEFTMYLIVSSCRELVPAFALRRLWFAHPRPVGSLAPLEAAFQTSALEFGAGENGFELDAALLDAPLSEADPALLKLLDAQASAVNPRRDAPFSVLVREQISTELATGDVSLERVAMRLKMSGRTLQRRLEGCGTSFHAEVESERRKVAAALLADRRVSISEISYRTGYSDVRAFSRAWRRWTGESPTDARATSSRSSTG